MMYIACMTVTRLAKSWVGIQLGPQVLQVVCLDSKRTSSGLYDVDGTVARPLCSFDSVAST